MPSVKVHEEGRDLYDGFYVPRFEVRAGGVNIAPAIVRDITSVTYKDNIKEIDSFMLTVNNWDARERAFRYIGAEAAEADPDPDKAQRFRMFEPCARELELALGYGSTLTTMVKGTCTTLAPSFPSEGPPILTVNALNVLQKLRKKKHQRNFENQTPSAIARKVGADLPLKVETNPRKPREEKLEYVAQSDSFDIDFLVLLARSVDYVVYVGQRQSRDRKKMEDFLYFGVSDDTHPAQRKVTYELEWGKSLIEFKPSLSTSQQVKSVEVRGWDRAKNKAIREIVKLDDAGIKINKDLHGLITRAECEPREEVVVKEPMRTPAQAKQRALAKLSEKLKELVTAKGITVGLPDLRAGQKVRIRGVGARFSGTYFVTDTEHTLDDKGYFTKFGARREEPEEAGGP